MTQDVKKLIDFYSTPEHQKYVQLVKDANGNPIWDKKGMPLLEVYAPEAIKQTIESENAVVHYISTPRIDYAHDIMRPKGCDSTALEKNKAVFYNHRWSGPTDTPIARCAWITKSREGVLCKTIYDVVPGVETFAGDIYRLVKGGFLNSFSIGFFPREFSMMTVSELPKMIDGEFDVLNMAEFKSDQQVVYHSKWDCYEYSQVSLPMNMDATVKAIQKGMAEGCVGSDYGKEFFGKLAGRQDLGTVDTATNAEPPVQLSVVKADEPAAVTLPDPGPDGAVEEKGVIRYKEYPLADEGTPWDAGKEVKAASVGDLKKMCSYFSGDGTKKGDYKLPHHQQSGYKTVWRGVANAAARLPQSSIPEEDQKGIRAHLGRHYEEFSKVPPWKKSPEKWDEYCKLASQTMAFADYDQVPDSWKSKEVDEYEALHKELFPELYELKAPAPDKQGSGDMQPMMDMMTDMMDMMKMMVEKQDQMLEILNAEDSPDKTGEDGKVAQVKSKATDPAAGISGEPKVIDVDAIRKDIVAGEINRVKGIVK